MKKNRLVFERYTAKEFWEVCSKYSFRDVLILPSWSSLGTREEEKTQKDRFPEPTSKRETGLNILVNLCISEIDKTTICLGREAVSRL